MDHEIDESRNLVVARVSGSVDSETLLAHLTRIKEDVRLRPGYRSWFDLTDAEPGDVGGEFVRRAADIARRFDERTGPVRVAVLAPDDLTFGLARMYSLLVGSLQREVRVFRSAADARAWLCVADPEGDVAA
ncbi:MAG: hypothetical protein JRG83_10830 [Deltaproteobacteria bacterium]|nr:hypothetical protein [Deltaproteobacteria bacterium]